MINITIICVGKLKEKFYTDAAKEYIKRLSGYAKTEVIELPEKKVPERPSPAEIQRCLEAEATAITEKIPKNALVAAMCIEGEHRSSEQFSEFIDGASARGVSRMCFVVGGSYGLHDSVKKLAELKLSMSKMTFPHNLARIMLLEQLYRAFKIREGGKYHK